MNASSETSVRFSNRRGQQLSGILHGEPAADAVICCHGMLSTKNGHKHLEMAQRLAAAGIATLRFDFAGRGESEGLLYDMTYSGEVEDLQAAVEYLAGRGVERFALFGSSMGGAVAYLAAARDERIIAVATLAAVGHPEELDLRYHAQVRDWRERGYIELEEGRLGQGFLEDALRHDVISAVGILRCPILVVHGELDEVVPNSDAHDIAAAARSASLHLVPGADHRFSRPTHRRAAVNHIAEFLVAQLERARPVVES